MKEIKGVLRQLGFSGIAEKIYLTLLKKGSCSIAELAQLTGKHRPAIYKSLPELTSSNLVSKFVKGKRIVYKAESPATISALSKKQIENVNLALPTLLDVFHNKDRKPKISFFEDKEGIATVYEQLISGTKKGEVVYRYESPKDYKKNKRYYPSLYWKRAGATGDIDKYVITNLKTHEKRHKNLNRFSKAVSIPFEDNITQIIGNGKVIFIDYDTETAVVIENDRFVDFQKSIFKMLFEKL
ncbi:MAG TPA: helix-turn-helix domain-containing protein [Candidatus Paceibacterota bacterium]